MANTVGISKHVKMYKVVEVCVQSTHRDVTESCQIQKAKCDSINVNREMITHYDVSFI